MLTKGSFAQYYGGCSVFINLSDESGSLMSPIFLAGSVAFQSSFLIFKKIKFREDNSQSHHPGS